MMYVLDTDILSLLAHKDSPEAPRIGRRIAQLPDDDVVVTTIINFEEQMRGWMAALARAKSQSTEIQVYARLLQHLLTFRRMTILAYDEASARHFQQLRSLRLPLGAMDMKIASIALSTNATLITRNLADFRRIPGLRIEDWSTESER
jgi:tRNA(fMet)-specific endonuclease VapC